MGTADLSGMRDCLFQEEVFNWGDGEGDAAQCKHVDPHLMKPADFPYPAMGV